MPGWGITFKTGLPGRTQARGLIERFQQSCWIRAARKLPTYVGSDMDGTTLYKATRLIESDVRKNGTSDRVIPWTSFVGFVAADAIDAYNNRPHSALPKITDDDGRRRHMTPNECWQAWLARGWEPDCISPEELADMWRPRIQRRTFRGEIHFMGNIYFSAALQHYSGQEMIVEYEPQDWTFVYVRDLDGRLIARAAWNGNRSGYQPLTAVEAAADKRAKTRRERVERKLEEIELEQAGAKVIDMQPDPAAIEARRMIEEEMARTATAPAEPAFPETDVGDWDKWRWCEDVRQKTGRVPAGHETFFESYRDFSSNWVAFMAVDRDLGGNNYPHYNELLERRESGTRTLAGTRTAFSS